MGLEPVWGRVQPSPFPQRYALVFTTMHCNAAVTAPHPFPFHAPQKRRITGCFTVRWLAPRRQPFSFPEREPDVLFFVRRMAPGQHGSAGGRTEHDQGGKEEVGETQQDQHSLTW